MKKSSSKKIKILFFAEAATLAHVSRPYQLAKSLDPERYEIHFATNDAYSFLFEDHDLYIHSINCISTDKFNKRLATGSPLYKFTELLSYVKEDCSIIENVNPDLVIGDFRLSLSVSARLKNIPFACISNAYWSEYSKRKNYPVPEHPLAKILGLKLFDKIFPIIRPLGFYFCSAPYNQLRKYFGLKKAKSLKEAFTDADYVLYPEIPSLIETKNLPSNHLYIDPIIWAPEIPLPKWTENEISSNTQKIFVSLGSSGDTRSLGTLIKVLGKMNCQVLVASAGRIEFENLPKNVHIEKFVNGTEAAKWADLMICNGGSGSTYQAIYANTPVIGICSNMDQCFNMDCIVSKGLGIKLRASEVTEKNVCAVLEQILEIQSNSHNDKFNTLNLKSDYLLFKNFINQIEDSICLLPNRSESSVCIPMLEQYSQNAAMF